jgi:hypothetical protein
MYTNKKQLKKALESLPISNLAVLAAALMGNQGGDLPKDVQEAIDDLLTDVLNVGTARVDDGYTDHFMQAVNWWYMEHNHREWYQRIVVNFVTTPAQPGQ